MPLVRQGRHFRETDRQGVRTLATVEGRSASRHEANACAVSWFDQAGQSNAFKKDIQLACHFLFLAPARFCGTSFPAASLAHVMSFVRQNTRSRGRNGSYFAIRAEAPGHRGCAEAFHEVILQGSVGGANT